MVSPGTALLRCALRIALVCAMPLVAILVGNDPGTAVSALSVISAIVEAGLTAYQLTSGASGPGPGGGSTPGGRKGRKSRNLRPPTFFPLQLGVLYSVQLWLLLLTSGTDPAAAAPPPAMEEAGEVSPGLRGSIDRAGQQVAADGAAAEGEEAPDAPDAPAATPVETGEFQLDAPKESLRWSPKTISVVLPCAEEREYALNTVKSVFESTPAEVLQEVVVVDDGSRVPLSREILNPEVQAKYKVKILRHEETVGLIGAKKTGGDGATGDIIVFFDCHVAPQPGWYKDFLELISENYRRMVVPQITALDVDTWKQQGSGGGMAKCYVTWDGDFKWGGTDDMYMAMLSGGLAGMSRRWWEESGGFDEQMLGWGGENIDQGVRMWVCGGEIVAAPHAQVAHMWRVGTAKTNARYKHVGDTVKNRARAIHAWWGEFTVKLEDYPTFKRRQDSGGDSWYGDMSSFQRVKERLQGCRPFAWYLRRFKGIYEDAGILPPEIFMIKEESSGKCLHFQGHAGTSGTGKEGVSLDDCDEGSARFFWHLGNVDRRSGTCCSGLRAWNTEQCFAGAQGGGKAVTGICDTSGRNPQQYWQLLPDGQLKRRNSCLGVTDNGRSLTERPCMAFRATGGGRFAKAAVRVPVETELYRKAMKENPELFRRLDEELAVLSGRRPSASGPAACGKAGACLILTVTDGTGRCLDDDGQLVQGKGTFCTAVLLVGTALKKAETGDCLDTWSDDNPETWGFYGCHGGTNQQFSKDGSQLCSQGQPKTCFKTRSWTLTAATG